MIECERGISGKNTDKGKPEYSEKNLSQCHVFNHKSYM
jgi:hypothetical protein